MSRWRILKQSAVALLIATLWAYGACLWYSRARIAFPSDPQSFWERVRVPQGIEMAEPILSTAHGEKENQATDRYSQALLRAASDPASSRTKAVCDISALDKLCAEREDWLLQYLACNPGWRLYTRYDRLFAERRVLRGDQWHWQDWEVMLDRPSSSAGDDELNMDFDTAESQCTICFGGLEFNWDKCGSGGQVALPLKEEGDDYNQIETVCDGEKLSVDVYESTTFVTSRLVQVVFDLAQKEFLGVQNTTNWLQMKAILPVGSVRRGLESLEVLYQLTSRGTILNYAYQAWVNPGEPGETYLRAFELSQGVELGFGENGYPAHLKYETREHSGWSENPEEKFMIGSRISLGTKVKFCAVRLEVWFTPANGGLERKLVERVFRVKGKAQ